MLMFLLILSMFGRGQSLVVYGFEFVTAFPENVAFFCPFYAYSSLNFTALYNDTKIEVHYNEALKHSTTLQQGETENYVLPGDVEETKLIQSLKSIRVTSSKYIVVLSITEQGDSVQTNILQPTQNLGTYYSIPQLDYSAMLLTFFQTAEIASKRYEFFRLVVINAVGVQNVVTIRYNFLPYTNYILEPWALLQLQLNGSEIAVDALYNVAVLVSHPCMEATNCKCNMVLNQLHPDMHWGQSFVVPAINNMTCLHVTENTLLTAPSVGNLVSVSSTHYVTTTYPASLRLISPGLIIEAIPVSLFSACYLVPSSLTGGSVLVIAETSATSQVHIDSKILTSQNWVTVPGTSYSSTSVPLNNSHVIWHPTSKIGVYMFRKMASGIQYGGPAVALSDKPDADGCLFFPTEYTVAPIPMSWPESHQYCLSLNGELVNPTTAATHQAFTDIMGGPTVQEYWMGLRRNLFTWNWYWYSGENRVELQNTQWNSAEADETKLGLCASILSDLTWKTYPCCTPLIPICFKKPDYFPIIPELTQSFLAA